MLRKFLLLLLVTCVAAAPVLGQAKTAVVLNPLSLTLPDTTATFPAGPSADAVNNNCLSCHSVEMVLNQPAMPKAAWEAEVAKMRNVYKAPVAEGDVAAIVDYLNNLKGTK
jgi:cytochrome c551/c552